MAIVKSIDHFRKYLYGREFLIRTDRAALSLLLRLKNLEEHFARWMEILKQYDLKIQHRPSRHPGNADALSRQPCGECKHCKKVDDAKALST